MEKKLVSIVTPTHQRSKMVQRAVDSLLAQTYENIEIIVVDDGSSDDTQDVLSSYTDRRLLVLKNETARGACHARNKGIAAASGEFITFLDDDDEFLPTRIEKMLKSWDDKWAYITTGQRTQMKYGRKGVFVPKEIICLSDVLYAHTAGNSVFTRRERMLELGGFDESLLSSQDYDVCLRLNQHFGDGFCIQEPLQIIHTEHDQPRISLSKFKFKGHFDFLKKHKSLMTKEHKKAKILELYKYKNRKISILKLIYLAKNTKSTATIFKLYLHINYPHATEKLKSIFGRI